MKILFVSALVILSFSASANRVTRSDMGNGITHWSVSCNDGTYMDGYSHIPLSMQQVQNQANQACANHGGLKEVKIKGSKDRNIR